MTEMHDVVEMLLNRIKDYPEDFYGVDPGRDFVHNKWIEALNTAKQVMTEEEKLIVEAELQAAKRAVYMGAALKTMLGPDEPMEEVINRKITTGSPFATTSLSQAQMVSTAIDESMLKELERQRTQRDMMMNAYGTTKICS